jgi:hypothetical protein
MLCASRSSRLSDGTVAKNFNFVAEPLHSFGFFDNYFEEVLWCKSLNVRFRLGKWESKAESVYRARTRQPRLGQSSIGSNLPDLRQGDRKH